MISSPGDYAIGQLSLWIYLHFLSATLAKATTKSRSNTAFDYS
jgi:hypothetical protein